MAKILEITNAIFCCAAVSLATFTKDFRVRKEASIFLNFWFNSITVRPTVKVRF